MSRLPDNDGRLDQPDPRKVMVVQNEPTLRLGFSYALTSPSLRVDVAATGQEILDRLEFETYDLIILELMMPGIDGMEVIEKLRSRGDKTPVILCTAMHRPNATLRALRFGVVDYLVKPVRPAEVRRIVGFVLEPGVDHFSRAMQAARSGDLAGAIQSLESIESLAPAELHWLRVLRLIRDRPSCDDEAGLDEQVRTSFPFLAFNAMDSH
jgi:DNA-binding response OmpR family regulator